MSVFHFSSAFAVRLPALSSILYPRSARSTRRPIIDNLLPQFGLEGQLEANEIDEETEDFLFPQKNTYFLFGKNEEGAALREDVDKALKEMKEDGTLSKITTEYLGVDTSPDEKYFDETPN